MVEAVSGQEVVEQRSNLIRELTRLCKAVIRSGEDLVYTGNTEGFAPDLRDALEMYVDESGSKVVIVTLLHKPETEQGPSSKEKVPFGCLVAEQIGDELAPTDMHARTEVVSRHASTALWNAQEHHKIFLKPVLKAMGSPWRMFRGRTLAKIVAVLAAVIWSGPRHGVRPLHADDRGPRLAVARGAAQGLCAGAGAIVTRGPRRPRRAGQEGGHPGRAREPRAPEGAAAA